MVGVPLRLAFAIFTAMLLTAPRRGVKLYRTLFYLPTLAPPVAAVLAFVVLLNPENGPVDQALGTVGLPAPLWFQDPAYAKWGLVLLGLWGVGDAMIIMLAGLLDVPRSLYEAAVTEGANAWHRFRYVTLPMLSPVILFTLVIAIINGFQYFTEGYVAATRLGGHAGRRDSTPGRAAGQPPLLLDVAVPAGLPLLPHGIRVGDGVAPVPGDDGVHAAARQDLGSLGALRERPRMSAVGYPSARRAAAGRPAPALPVRRRRSTRC